MQFSGFIALLRRYPHCAVCAALTIVFGLTSWILHGQIADLEVSQSERAREGEAMLDLLVGGTTQRQELTVAREVARRIETNLVVEENLAENSWYFYKLEEQTRVRLPSLHQLSSPPGDASPLFKRIPYTIRVTGDYEQVASFLLALETGPRLINIIAFTCSRSGGVELSLDLSIELLGKK